MMRLASINVHSLMTLRRRIAHSTFVHLLCLLPVLMGMWFGTEFLRFQVRDAENGFLIQQPTPTLLNVFANWDGVWYERIARSGYSDPDNQGAYFVFFPIYPLIGRGVARLTGFGEVLSLLIVAHAALIGGIVLLRYYLPLRFPDWSPCQIDSTIVVLLCLPNSMYLRFGYSESLFLFLILLAAILMERGCQPWMAAIVVGAASGVRAIGAGLVIVVLYHTWVVSRSQESTFIRRCGGMLLPATLSLWGIAAYSLFLWLVYGDPRLFQRSHRMFDLRSDSALSVKAWNLLTLEPIWSVYFGRSLNHWAAEEAVGSPVFVQRFVNPLYFVASVALVVYGRFARIITTREWLFAVILLGIPYATKGHDGAMQGLARYVIVVFPAWIVLSKLLSELSEVVKILLIGLGFAILALNAAQFAAWYPLV